VTGVIDLPAGPIPRVSSVLSAADHFGSIKARWGVGRMNFMVDPGLYALGTPDHQSLIFVTANYKMSFDRLRRDLKNRDAWVLALDTKGINVWCAAGKGTFGTDEIMEKIRTSGLAQIVSHRELILPQLAAPGVAAYVVKKNTGFNVKFGPVRSSDLPVFIDSGYKATPEMRLKTFPIMERAALIPMELVIAMKWMLIVLPAIFLLSGMIGPGPFRTAVFHHGFFAALMLLGGLVAGTIVSPLFLPWLPGRAFALKGLWAAILVSLIIIGLFANTSIPMPHRMEIFALILLSSALSAFLAMNFTGSSTYTSLSGVRKEMKWAVPFLIMTGLAGLGLWIGTLYTA
jgi:hypothetical protein